MADATHGVPNKSDIALLKAILECDPDLDDDPKRADALTPEKLDELERWARAVIAWNDDEPDKWISYNTLVNRLKITGDYAELIALLPPKVVLALIAAARERDAAIRRAEAAEIGEKSANALLDTSITDGQRQVQRIRELEADLKARNDQIDGYWRGDDVRTCGELSCDECTERYMVMRKRAEQAEQERDELGEERERVAMLLIAEEELNLKSEQRIRELEAEVRVAKSAYETEKRCAARIRAETVKRCAAAIEGYETDQSLVGVTRHGKALAEVIRRLTTEQQ